MKTNSCRDQLRVYLDTIPIIDTHVHCTSNAEPLSDVLPLVMGYLKTSFRLNMKPWESGLIQYMNDPNVSFRDRYAVFEKYYETCKYTTNARNVFLGMKMCWGIEDLSYNTLCQLNERLSERNNDFYERTMERFHIEYQIADTFDWRFFDIMSGKDKNITKYSKFAFPFPIFYRINDYDTVAYLRNLTNCYFYSLDEYVAAFEKLLTKAKEWGIVCIKDQNAYYRDFDYTNPSHDQAEAVFNKLLSNPKYKLGSVEGKPLADWLYHQFLNIAGKLEIPVQIHTGFLDILKVNNDRPGMNVVNANASHLIPVINQHSNVHFDLFHGNWPYKGEYLAMGASLPNVTLDLCWLPNLDSPYARDLLKRAVLSLPSNKILVYGGDNFYMESGIGSLEQTKDCAADALFDLIHEGYVTENDAREIAMDWFYRNPKAIFSK